MARLAKGERQQKQGSLLRFLRRFRWGIREGELSEELGWQRRTLNNYLRDLEKEDKAYREGRSWFAK
jgi:DNA-binding IclR family transcriptional regulator